MGLSLILMEFKRFRASEKKRMCRDPKEECVRVKDINMGVTHTQVSETSQREHAANFFVRATT